MANGIINLTSTSAYIAGRIVWESVGSTVSCTLELKAVNGHTATSGTWSWSIGIGLSSDSGSTYRNIKNTEWRDVGSFSASELGSSVTISAACEYPSGTSQAGYRCYGSATVQIAQPEPERPDASTIITASDSYFGDVCYVSWIPSSTEYSYSITVRCADRAETYGDIIPNSVDLVRHGVIIPYDFIYEVSEGLTQAVTVSLSTFSDGEQLGESSEVQILCTIPDNDATKPDVTAFSPAPSPDPFGGAYIQSQTGVCAQVLTAVGKYGASIVSTHFRLEGKLYSGAENSVSDVIAQFGQITVTAFAVDSRGFTSNGYPVEIAVIPYARPKLRPIDGQHRVSAVRCDSDGNPDSDGTHLIIMAKREYSAVIFNDAQQNFCSIRYRYKPDTSTAWSDWAEILAGDDTSDEVVSQPQIGALAPKSTYQIEIQALDTLGGSGSTIITVASDRIYDHIDGAKGSYGFGKYVELDDVFDIAEDKDLILRGGLLLMGRAYQYLFDLMHPIGSVLETVNHSNPGDDLGGTWVLADETESAYKWRRTE